MKISAREILKENKRRSDNMNELSGDFGKCIKEFKKARSDIKKCIQNALTRGLTQKEIMAVADRYFSGDCELCNMIIFAELMNYEFKQKIHQNYEL
jgi:hypothetical protein